MKEILLSLTVLLIFSCTSKKEAEEKEEVREKDTVLLSEEQIKQAGIVTDTIRKQTLHTELVVNGKADVPPQNMVSISFPLGGYLKTTSLLPGMKINKGQVIAIMEDQSLIQLQQDYLMATSKFKYLQQDLERQRVLNEGGANAGKQLQQVQTDFHTQEIQIKGYEEKLKLAGINPATLSIQTISRSVPVYAPITGYVSKVNINIGKYVNPADVLFELINPTDIHAALTIFEKDVQKIRNGQKVWVSFVDDPAKEYECEVLLITRNVDDNRSATVHCHFIKQPLQLLPGMYLRARVQLDSVRSAAVPEEAVVRYGGKSFIVLNEKGNAYALQEVEAGTGFSGMVALKNDNAVLEGRVAIIKNAYAILGKIKNTADED